MMMQGVVGKASSASSTRGAFGVGGNRYKRSTGHRGGRGNGGGQTFIDLVQLAQQSKSSNNNNNKKSSTASKASTNQTLLPSGLLKPILRLTAPIKEEYPEGEGERPEEPPTKCQQFVEMVGKAGINHLASYLILIIYAFIGAGIFEATEEANEIRERAAREQGLNESSYNLSAAILKTIQEQSSAIFPPTFNKEIFQQNNEEEEILKRISALIRGYQRDERLWPGEHRNWDFWGALFYAGTIFTTIGYGHYYPVTVLGRIATMFYAVLGIPLVLAVLSDLGGLLARFFKWVCSFVRKLKHCRKKKRWASSEEDSDSYLEWLESKELDVPIPVAILLLIGWIFLCAAVFCIWETEWTFFNAFYFFFISLTTIGLGDITPNHPRYMIAGCVFVIIGLALISMVINLIQIKLEEFKEATADLIEEELGWDTESESGDEHEDNEPHHRSTNDTKNKSNNNNEPAAVPAHKLSSISGGRASLGVFSTGFSTNVHHSKKISVYSNDKLPVQAKKRYSATSTENQSIGKKTLADKWANRVVDTRRRRRRRGIQTDDSFLQSVHRRFPQYPNYLAVPESELRRSHDDVNSLVDQMEFIKF